MNRQSDNYEDILDLERPISLMHNPMSIMERAAQFAPFSALTGHSDAIAETARLTENYLIPDEGLLEELNEKLLFLENEIQKHPKIFVRYFVPDENKSGGRYEEYTGEVKKIDQFMKKIYFSDDTEMFFGQIFEIELPTENPW